MGGYRREESSGFVGRGEQDSVHIHLKQGRFESSLGEIVVYHKRTFKTMRPQEVGDGMQPVLLVKKSSQGFVFDQIAEKRNRAFVCGLCQVLRWNEEDGSSEFVLPQMNAQKKDRVNSFLSHFGCDEELVTDAKTKQVSVRKNDSKDISLVNDVQTTLVSIQEGVDCADYTSVFPFLLGITLGFGELKIVRDIPVHAKVHIAVENTEIVDLFSQIEHAFRKNALFLSSSLKDKDVGQLLQVDCKDRQVLEYMMCGIEEDGSTYEPLELKKGLYEYCENFEYSLDEDIDLPENPFFGSKMVLKLLRK